MDIVGGIMSGDPSYLSQGFFQWASDSERDCLSKNRFNMNSLGGIDEGSLGDSQFRTSEEQTKEIKGIVSYKKTKKNKEETSVSPKK